MFKETTFWKKETKGWFSRLKEKDSAVTRYCFVLTAIILEKGTFQQKLSSTTLIGLNRGKEEWRQLELTAYQLS